MSNKKKLLNQYIINPIKYWWNGSRLSTDYQKRVPSWQQMVLYDDIINGFFTRNSSEEFMIKSRDLLIEEQKANSFFSKNNPTFFLIFNHLLKGRRVVSTLLSLTTAVLPLELFFRFINAGVETLYDFASQKYKMSGSFGWGCLKAVSFIAKCFAKVTDFFIVAPASGIRNSIDSLMFGVIPISPFKDACEAWPTKESNLSLVRKVGVSVGQFFKSWGYGFTSLIRGALKAVRPIALVSSMGFAGVACAALSSFFSVTSLASHIPLISSYISSSISKTITLVSTSTRYLPSCVSNFAARKAIFGLQNSLAETVNTVLTPKRVKQQGNRTTKQSGSDSVSDSQSHSETNSNTNGLMKNSLFNKNNSRYTKSDNSYVTDMTNNMGSNSYSAPLK